MAANTTPRQGLLENPWVVRPQRPRIGGTNDASQVESPARTLEITSQGRPQDKPPELWIRPELRAFNAISTCSFIAPNLTGACHNIFARERWPYMTRERFDAFEQTFLLASKLLDLGMTYLASFLPLSDGNSRQVRLKNLTFIQEIRNTNEELDSIPLASVLWAEDKSILRCHGRWSSRSLAGVGLPACYTSGLELPNREVDKAWKDQGVERREIVIFIASQYIDLLLATEPGSDRHLRATFHAAVTMVREIAHVVWWQDINHNDRNGIEPFVDGQCEADLGLAFTSWIFGGWNPEPIDEKGEFRLGMYWKKQLSGRIERPTWRMQYSMNMEYVQALLAQATWDQLPGEKWTPQWTGAFPRPRAPFINGNHARVALCDKTVARGRWEWKDFGRPNARRRFRTLEHHRVHRPNDLPAFYDHDWILGSRSETSMSEADNNNLREAQGAAARSPTADIIPPEDQSDAAVQSITRVTVVYMGEFYETTQQTRKRQRENDDGRATEQPATKRIRFDWPNAVLRGECAARDISAFGEREDLIDRLAAFDAQSRRESDLGADDTQQSGQNVAPTTSTTAQSEENHQFILELNLSITTLRELSNRIHAVTGIEPRFQYLLFGQSSQSVAATPSNDEDNLESVNLQNRFERQWGVTNNVELYRIQLRPMGDPGPRLFPPVQPSTAVTHPTINSHPSRTPGLIRPGNSITPHQQRHQTRIAFNTPSYSPLS